MQYDLVFLATSRRGGSSMHDPGEGIPQMESDVWIVSGFL
jgi:hypothetical protein